MAFSLRSSWSNYILHLSNYIYRKKQALVVIHGLESFFTTLLIVGAEALFLIISLPSYLAAKPVTDVKGRKEYRLRRAMTFSVIATLCVIWVIKLLLTLGLAWHANYVQTAIYETKNNAGNSETNADEILIAKTSNALAVPTVTKIQNMRDQVTFWGTAPANSIVSFAFSEKSGNGNLPPKMYFTPTDAKGNFTLIEDVKVFNLPTGNYTVSATTYDPIKNVKSANSQTFSFAVKESFWNIILRSADSILNILALLVILGGILMTVLVT